VIAEIAKEPVKAAVEDDEDADLKTVVPTKEPPEQDEEEDREEVYAAPPRELFSRY